MKLSLNTNSKFLRAPSIRQFSNRIKYIDDCVNLTIGQPDFPMPDVVKEAYINAIKEDKTSYSHNKGYQKQDKRSATTLIKNMDLPIAKSLSQMVPAKH